MKISVINVGDVFYNPKTGKKIKVVSFDVDDSTGEDVVIVDDWVARNNAGQDLYKHIGRVISITRLNDAWKRINENVIKCECGGDIARTTHSDWCPKYSPYKAAKLLHFTNIFFKLAQVLNPGESALSIEEIQQQMQKWKSYIEAASISERAGWSGQEGKLVIAVIDKILNNRPISGLEAKNAVMDVNSNVPDIDAMEFKKYIDAYPNKSV